MSNLSLKSALAKKEAGALNIIEEINNNGLLKIIFEHKGSTYCLDGYRVLHDKDYFEKEPYKVTAVQKTVTYFD